MMMHDHSVKMCPVEANSIEEGLLNMYLAFEAAEGVGNTNMVSACPAQSAILSLITIIITFIFIISVVTWSVLVLLAWLCLHLHATTMLFGGCRFMSRHLIPCRHPMLQNNACCTLSVSHIVWMLCALLQHRQIESIAVCRSSPMPESVE